MGGFLHLDFLGEEQKKLEGEEDEFDDDFFDMVSEHSQKPVPQFGDVSS